MALYEGIALIQEKQAVVLDLGTDYTKLVVVLIKFTTVLLFILFLWTQLLVFKQASISLIFPTTPTAPVLPNKASKYVCTVKY